MGDENVEKFMELIHGMRAKRWRMSMSQKRMMHNGDDVMDR